MNVRCPDCQKLYRVDPARVPAEGVRTRCVACRSVFFLSGDGQPTPEPAPFTSAAEDAAASAEHATTSVMADPAEGRTAPSGGVQWPFQASDADARARRIARALVSDMVAYHGERRDKSLATGRLRVDFRQEILQSWSEYVEQVGDEMAKSTPYFREALNEILAGGEKVF